MALLMAFSWRDLVILTAVMTRRFRSVKQDSTKCVAGPQADHITTKNSALALFTGE